MRDALNIRSTRFRLLEGPTLAAEDAATKAWLGMQPIDGSYQQSLARTRRSANDPRDDSDVIFISESIRVPTNLVSGMATAIVGPHHPPVFAMRSLFVLAFSGPLGYMSRATGRGLDERSKRHHGGSRLPP